MSDNKVTLDQLDNSAVEAMSSSVGDVSMLNTENKTIVGALAEIVGKKEIANAIGEPLAETDKFTEMSSEINGLLSTFKTNMMNAGVVVESEDKFKALIDKIKGLTEGEGNRGIQYGEGVVDISDQTGITKTQWVIPINIGFTPTIVLALVGVSNSEDAAVAEQPITNLSYTRYNGTKNKAYKIIEVNDSSITIGTSGTGHVLYNDLKWYAIGVGEEDTTLRDSLAYILENKGVDVTEEDDMASLISKVDNIEIKSSSDSSDVDAEIHYHLYMPNLEYTSSIDDSIIDNPSYNQPFVQCYIAPVTDTVDVTITFNLSNSSSSMSYCQINVNGTKKTTISHMAFESLNKTYEFTANAGDFIEMYLATDSTGSAIVKNVMIYSYYK